MTELTDKLQQAESLYRRGRYAKAIECSSELSSRIALHKNFVRGVIQDKNRDILRLAETDISRAEKEALEQEELYKVMGALDAYLNRLNEIQEFSKEFKEILKAEGICQN